MNSAGLYRYLVLLTLDYSTTVGGGVHEHAVKTKPVAIRRKPWKIPMELDLIMNTDVSTLMSVKKEPVSPHPFALQKFPSQHSEHVTMTSKGEPLFLLALHSWKDSLIDWMIDWLVSNVVSPIFLPFTDFPFERAKVNVWTCSLFEIFFYFKYI